MIQSMKALGSALALLLLATTIACGGEGSDDPASGTTQALAPAAPVAVDQPVPSDLGTPPGASVAPIPLSAPALQDPFAVDSAEPTTPHADPCVAITAAVHYEADSAAAAKLEAYVAPGTTQTLPSVQADLYREPSPVLAAVRAEAKAGEFAARLEQPPCPR